MWILGIEWNGVVTISKLGQGRRDTILVAILTLSTMSLKGLLLRLRQALLLRPRQVLVLYIRQIMLLDLHNVEDYQAILRTLYKKSV